MKRKLQYSITIDAPRSKVWQTMLDESTYREWTKAFNETSRFRGSWEKGSKILFIGSDPVTGKEAGMVSRIADNRLHEFISIEHLGLYQDGVEDTTSPEATRWAPAFENYTLTEKNGGTEVLVDMDLDAEHAEAFGRMWEDALQRLKKLSEGR